MRTDTISANTARVLLIDHQKETLKNTAFLLRLAGYDVKKAGRLDEAINIITVFYPVENSPAVILLNNLPIDKDLREKLDLLASRCLNSQVLVVDRGAESGLLNKLGQPVISPGHILTEVRKVVSRLTAIDQTGDHFLRFHSTR